LKFLWDWGVGIQSIEFWRCNSFDPKGFLRGISYGLESFKIPIQTLQSKEALNNSWDALLYTVSLVLVFNS
jgi:hypothetical protein